MKSVSPLSDFCDLTKRIAERDNKTWGQVIEEITESLKEKDYSLNTTKENSQIKNYDSILAPGEDFDNDVIYDTRNGKTVREVG